MKVTRIVMHASFFTHASYWLLHYVLPVFIDCSLFLGSTGNRERVRGFWRVRVGRTRAVPVWRNHRQDDRDLDTVSSFVMLRVTFPSLHARCLPHDTYDIQLFHEPQTLPFLANIVWLSRLAQPLMGSIASCRCQLVHVITWAIWYHYV